MRLFGEWKISFFLLLSLLVSLRAGAADLVVRGETIHTMSGPALKDGVVVIRNGKITAVGTASEVSIPAGVRTISAKVVTPGLVDAHSPVWPAISIRHPIRGSSRNLVRFSPIFELSTDTTRKSLSSHGSADSA